MQRPWNIPNFAVYSLATVDKENGFNYNICTYVSAVSMKPKLYAIAIYNNTRTLYNAALCETAVLQLLHKGHYHLVKPLGKTTGKSYNKWNYLQKKDLLEAWNHYEVIRNTAARVLLKKLDCLQAGDHCLYIYEAVKYNSYHNNYLDVETLKRKKLIR